MTTILNNPNTTATYRYYLLFRTYRWQAGQQVKEAAHLSVGDRDNSLIHYQVSKDKRLFLGPLFSQVPLTTLPVNLLKHWQTFQQLYGQDAETLLLGVVLLTVNDSVNQPPPTVTLTARYSASKFYYTVSINLCRIKH